MNYKGFKIKGKVIVMITNNNESNFLKAFRVFVQNGLYPKNLTIFKMKKKNALLILIFQGNNGAID